MRIKLVPNYQTRSKNILGHNKRNGPIASNFGPIKTWLILHRISKMCKFPGLVYNHSFRKCGRGTGDGRDRPIPWGEEDFRVYYDREE